MGDTYAKVQESNDIANFQELTEMIIEIEKLMFWKKKLTHKHFLHQCDFLSREEAGNDKIIEKIKFIKMQLSGVEKSMNDIKQKVKKNNILELEGDVIEIKGEQMSMKLEIQQALEKNSQLIALLSDKSKKS